MKMFKLNWLKNLNAFIRNIFISESHKILLTSGVAVFMITGIAFKSFAQNDEVELTIEIVQKGSKDT
ncbi:MAG TPA: hypothetical protein VEW65_16245, partial [Chryseolinea sp.]|nr:hypothetical protein [Chryseolinea sp.]